MFKRLAKITIITTVTPQASKPSSLPGSAAWAAGLETCQAENAKRQQTNKQINKRVMQTSEQVNHKETRKDNTKQISNLIIETKLFK